MRKFSALRRGGRGPGWPALFCSTRTLRTVVRRGNRTTRLQCRCFPGSALRFAIGLARQPPRSCQTVHRAGPHCDDLHCVDQEKPAQPERPQIPEEGVSAPGCPPWTSSCAVGHAGPVALVPLLAVAPTAAVALPCAASGRFLCVEAG